MKSLKQIKGEINNITEIRGLIEVYEEMSASKMQKIRSSIIASHEYFEGLARISGEVALDLFTNSDSKTKGEAAILISAETGLYGDLIDKLLVGFVDFVKKNKADAFIAGRMGVNLIKTYDPSFKFKQLNFPVDSENMSSESAAAALNDLSEYKKISVFHGTFQSLAVQSVEASDVSGKGLDVLGKDIDKSEAKKTRLTNLYEPSVEAVGEKFSKEIAVSVLSQSFAENQLAKYAARLIHLDGALESINERMESYQDDERRMRKKNEQKKQTERVSRMISLQKFI
ncbi:MAG TPA: F0F1 ATP synthase subunit gamma [Alphaproteobacteria bacterium]|jgi:F0F1-type ATP synthase gamma subunit|nr:F0F1 ATP synthase subunit gamma [Alphaproteobacteria bacterium]